MRYMKYLFRSFLSAPKRLKSVWVLGVCILGICVAPSETKVTGATEVVKAAEAAGADMYTDAYQFYQEYGSDMTFHVDENGKGVIYYGTRGPNASTAKTRYGTVGWKVTVRDHADTVIDTLYFKIGGAYITAVDHQVIDGYVYMLYACPLDKLKESMSQAGREALKNADCSIVFDACMIVKLNDIAQGGIEDGGQTWGTVYTTYDGIVNAKSWSSSSKTNLKSYFGKKVTGLFYQVTLSYGEGITEVSGAGSYCYGSEVTVSASVKKGYAFEKWTGAMNSSMQTLVFVIGDADVCLHAEAYKSKVTVNYYRNWNPLDTLTHTKVYSYVQTLWVSLIDCGWTKEGYHQIGWNPQRHATNAMYSTTQSINRAWYDTYFPEVDLYAVWEENTYRIAFDSSGGKGRIEQQLTTYTDTTVLPSVGFSKEGSSLAGWSLYEGDSYVEYACGEEVLVSYLVEEMALGYEDGAVITLYAVWDEAPEIQARDIYITLEDAKEGRITEEWLVKQISATDVEDGELTYSPSGKNGVFVMDYSPSDFTGFTKEGYVTETYCAVDNAGNRTTKQIKVHMVDNQVYSKTKLQGRPRFLSVEYYRNADGIWVTEEAGGLWSNSVWRLDSSYTRLLDLLFYAKSLEYTQ